MREALVLQTFAKRLNEKEPAMNKTVSIFAA